MSLTFQRQPAKSLMPVARIACAKPTTSLLGCGLPAPLKQVLKTTTPAFEPTTVRSIIRNRFFNDIYEVSGR